MSFIDYNLYISICQYYLYNTKFLNVEIFLFVITLFTIVKYNLVKEQNSSILLLGSRIKKEREKRGMAQVELAALSKTSAGALSLIEREKRIPGSYVLERIAKALGVTTDYLLGAKKSKDVGDYLKDQQIETILEELQDLPKKKRDLVLKFIRMIASDE